MVATNFEGVFMKKYVVAVLLLFVFLLSGCQMKEEVEPVRLSFIHGWGGTLRAHSIMQEIYDDFDAANEDISLSSQPSSDSSIAVEKANDMLALDEMPNIVSTNGQYYYVENAVKRGKLLDLMSYIRKDSEFMKLVHPSVLEVWTNTDGSLYTLPDALEVMGYWYNEEYFREAGIVDEKGEIALPETWQEFYEVCKKLETWNRTSGKLEAVYALENVQVVENLFLARLGGESTDGLILATDIPESYDSETFRGVIKDFANIYQYSKNTDSLENARQYFIEGATAMYFNGVWESEVIQSCERSEEIAYANYPTNYGMLLSYVSPSSGYVVYKSPDQRENEASIRFLKYMLSPEIQTRIAMETGQAPSNPKVDNQVVAKKYPVLGNALEVAHSAGIQLKTITSVWNSEAIEIVAASIEKACQSDEELEKMIENLEITNKND